jgi:hypothetical protein
MAQLNEDEQGRGRPAPASSALGATWWISLIVVSVVLGFVDRSQGFWSVFLWCVVGFTVGTLLAYLVSGGAPGGAAGGRGAADGGSR